MTNQLSFSIAGWLPNGAHVTFSVPVNAEHNAYEEAVEFTGKLLAKGFLQREPDGTGEQTEPIGYVVKRSKENDDGSITPIIDFYSPNDKVTWKLVHHYLDTADDITAFENASGVRVADMKVWEAQPLERGAKQSTNEYVYRVGKPFSVVIKQNPKYNPDEPDAKKRKQKNLLVRYEVASNIIPMDAPNVSQSNVEAVSSDLAVASGQNTHAPAKTPTERLMGNGHKPGEPRTIAPKAENPPAPGWKSTAETANVVFKAVRSLYKAHDHMINSIKKLEAAGKLTDDMNPELAIATIQNHKDDS